jgi:hypothetical protein
MINSCDRYFATAWKGAQRQRTFSKKNHRSFWSGIILQRCAGILIIITLTIGVTSTLWFGMQIQTALDEIGKVREVKFHLAEQNNALKIDKIKMLSRSRIETAAKGLGLQAPTAGQIRTP